MKLYTSYYANYQNIPKDLYCIGISRMCPEWFKNNHLTNFVHYKNNFLAPSEKLLSSFKADECTEEDYKRTYITDLFTGLKEMGYQDIPSWVSVLESNYSSNWKGVVFLCYEKPENFCHRHLFRRLLKNIYGIPCEEYGVPEEKTYGYVNKTSKNSVSNSVPLF